MPARTSSTGQQHSFLEVAWAGGSSKEGRPVRARVVRGRSQSGRTAGIMPRLRKKGEGQSTSPSLLDSGGRDPREAGEAPARRCGWVAPLNRGLYRQRRGRGKRNSEAD